ncbi:M67 family metallopeptidase [Pectinatus cerevisiiphilus]|uniref:Proteasome lid subunit RPN8/RPN11 n=1 Tax=Pectinatus cerevisiiphilus TaxID=86956 RepID=A0A4R3K040_9FIRM|nr:M67 family metallopeptidase [Pectinatus cerevisiiphilus]TCS75200.1 proteasome lid subunit RPN8/RPN11 [Pectinatus cerevisiiphilus]
MIILKKAQLESIIDYARKNLPDEACGLLGGYIKNNERTVEKVFFLTNTDHSPEHFSMDPKEQFAAVKDMRKHGYALLGNFHSHPASPARPSVEDKRLAFDPSISYLILSLAEKDPVLKSFKIENKNSQEESITIL